MANRRTVLKAGAAGLLTSLVSPWSYGQTVATLLSSARSRQFTNLLPNPLDPANLFAPDAAGGTSYTFKIREFSAPLGLVDPSTGKALKTTLWGYGTASQAPSYPGRTLNLRRGVPITVRYQNELMNSAGPLPHRLPVDSTIDWANPGNLGGRAPVPLVAHRHGGEQVSNSDGLPEAWATPDTNQDGMPDYRGRLFSATYTFDNSQEAGHLWYHDHALGVTRLNVYMGLAGNYFIRDNNEDYLVRTGQLPAYPYEVPLCIQDRQFNAKGGLNYPATDPANPQAPTPTHLPEFFGDLIVVNGTPWPRLDCEPRMYRLRLLNGSDSRVYTLSFNLEKFPGNRLTFWQIGTDLGLMNSPVALTSLTLAPGERADLLVDFSKVVWWWHGKVIVKNSANTPFPNGLPPTAGTTDRVMAFSVTKPMGFFGFALSFLRGAGSVPGNLRPVHGALPVPATSTAKVRKLMLFEGTDAYGRLQTMLGTVNPAPGNPAGPGFGSFLYTDPVTETIKAGSTEIWEIHNTTVDAHPIHLHLVDFRILDRQGFTGTLIPKPMGPGGVATGGYLTNIALSGSRSAALPNEQGRKDTVLTYPGQVTRIIATFNRPGEYVWHCHILSHEDHEMMRRFVVT
jgi:spore coat protein A, manganese oxidase